ncbi:GntR family transcriptional regulator [Mucilaginibacter sp. AW1-7]|jgi:DNA-binding transcriptional regulator YhcF (GntR family)|uniref:GntR family transcriptional regulator n=1 Tax=unclassified Mucilaginibacter TaxID=2617802 RepID=UPI002367299D|nr:GntR family transcriptional regulator [Mucilaginibacter sp. KACC 22773]WDF77364.1 GntR family transcriptional regulator [Mucilaginibacter sp. KACC 22773]
MEFKDKDAIYLQIAAYVSENILLGKWLPEEKIPSTRDMAVELEVNPNTVIRAYEFLQSQEVVINKRGLGLFVAPDGPQKVKAYRKQRFIQQQLPDFFRNIYLLDIDIKDLENMYKEYTAGLTQPKADENK